MKLSKITLILIISIYLIKSTVSISEIPNIGIGSKDEVSKDALMQKVYYSIRSDNKQCSTPHCGGYFIKKLNSIEGTEDSQEIYISEMMTSNPLLNSTMINQLKQIQQQQQQQQLNMIIQPPFTLVVSGDITPSHSNDGLYHCLHLTDILHVMSIPIEDLEINKKKQTIKPQEQYYFIKPSPYKCNGILTDCPAYVVMKANTHEIEFLQSYVESYTTSIPMLDQHWLNSRLVSENSDVSAMVKGYIVGEKLTISYIFLNTIDPPTKCKPPQVKRCENLKPNQIPVFTRTIDRCVVFTECIERGPCHFGVPSCTQGYHPSVIQVAPKGCRRYYCDPDFLPIISQLQIN
ncbi:hypothetical protein RB653_008184 [Dictyostelium firmibasis]|uniref:DUF6748 domain-containing protein n=1 Tax=Dictyostelium firmibasis TaxID=79012 RepID=A0AAN7YWF1_9MYCE